MEFQTTEFTSLAGSAVAMKVDCDLQLTPMSSSLYRLLAVRVGNGYEVAKSRHLFRDFIDATAVVVSWPGRNRTRLVLG
jgi:hypothetical protein